MCTAISFKSKNYYFGRNLDLDLSYGEEVCVIPRNYIFSFRKLGKMDKHYAMIGMATVVDNMPLFYDGMNEYGVAMAGLNFPGNACYNEVIDGKDNICQFEFIPYILGKCKDLIEVKEILNNINLINMSFSDSLVVSPLHYMISYRDESIVVEFMRDGMHICDNPVGVLTNNPPFKYQLFNLNNYRHLNVMNGENNFSNKLELEEYCQGLGALGLPGDVSSMSRFVRMVFNKEHSVCGTREEESISQFFHLLTSVEMVRGSCMTKSGKCDITIYSSCMNTDKGLYYYKTYDNQQINCIDIYKIDLDGNMMSCFPLLLDGGINYQN